MQQFRIRAFALLFISILGLTGCGTLGMATAKVALPPYLVALDGALKPFPKSESMLTSAAELNSTYAGVFVKKTEKKQRIAKKSLDYGFRAICVHSQAACGLREMNFPEFEKVITSMNSEADLRPLFVLGSAWAGYIQLNTSDWKAIGDLAKVQKVMEQVVSIDEDYQNGMALLYLGVLNSLLPPALGGKPEVGKQYFEKALEVSGRKNLVIQVMYAQQYARLVYDKELHDSLLQEVLAASPNVKGLTLPNVYAQSEARRLLAESEDFF